jgi:hypothetical protein
MTVARRVSGRAVGAFVDSTLAATSSWETVLRPPLDRLEPAAGVGFEVIDKAAARLALRLRPIKSGSSSGPQWLEYNACSVSAHGACRETGQI